MPVRSLTSSVLKWPDAETVAQAVREWASAVVRSDQRVERIGYFGSYARGDWGVGSDLDVIIVLTHSDQPFGRRGVEWDTLSLPVPVDLLVYTRDEWRRLRAQSRPWLSEIIWLYEAEESIRDS